MKYCTKCGTPIDQGENFCTQCGAPVQRREDVEEKNVLKEKTIVLKNNVKSFRDNLYNHNEEYISKDMSNHVFQKNETHAESSYDNSSLSEENQESSFVYDNYNSSEDSNGAAVGSLVLGILSLVFVLGVIAVPLAGLVSGVCAVIGIVLGASGRKKQFRQGMATAGLICSVIALVLSVIGLVGCMACAGCLGLSALSL